MNRATNNSEQAALHSSGSDAPPLCPACGAAARRSAARYCATCGRSLDRGGYLPADTLRASYHEQHQRHSAAHRQVVGAHAKPPMPSLFPNPNRNAASTTALAFATYALVPYLGILFCPGAVMLGGIGLIYSLRAPQRGGRRASYISITAGVIILCVQLFLWWIIIKVPEWTGGF